MDFQKELIDHIKARYPILYVVTNEEARVLTEFGKIAQITSKSLWIWSVSDGLLDSRGAEVKDAKGEMLHSPLKALRHMLHSQERALFLCKDLHLFLEDPFSQYLTDPLQVRRVLRDIAVAFRSSFKNLILVSPVLKIPADLEKDISVFDFPAPNQKEIASLLDATIADVKRIHGDKVEVELDADAREAIVKSVSGLTLSEIENVLMRAIVNDLRFNRDDIPFILSEKKQIIRKSGLLEYFEVQEDFGNVGGLEILKDWLVKRGEAFQTRAKEFGLPEPKGILLLGVQGCGKSLISKAISSLWRLPLLRLDVGAIFGKYVGESEENLRRAIRMAESLSPTILWLDEIEKAFAGVGGDGGDGGVGTRIFGTFITWLQEKTVPVFVIATSNDIKHLPPELLRKGRFDEIFFVDLPSGDERKEIFRIHLRKRRRSPEAFDLPLLAEKSEAFSGAEIEQAIISGMFDAFHAKRELTTEDIIVALGETFPLAVTMREQIEGLRTWAFTRAKRASGGTPPQTPASLRKTPDSSGKKPPGFSPFADLGLDT
ncbi:MAG: AAA family ATPase [Candidatus Ozemobacteraceae bacterium]